MIPDARVDSLVCHLELWEVASRPTAVSSFTPSRSPPSLSQEFPDRALCMSCVGSGLAEWEALLLARIRALEARARAGRTLGMLARTAASLLVPVYSHPRLLPSLTDTIRVPRPWTYQCSLAFPCMFSPWDAIVTTPISVGDNLPYPSPTLESRRVRVSYACPSSFLLALLTRTPHVRRHQATSRDCHHGGHRRRCSARPR